MNIDEFVQKVTQKLLFLSNKMNIITQTILRLETSIKEIKIQQNQLSILLNENNQSNIIIEENLIKNKNNITNSNDNKNNEVENKMNQTNDKIEIVQQELNEIKETITEEINSINEQKEEIIQQQINNQSNQSIEQTESNNNININNQQQENNNNNLTNNNIHVQKDEKTSIISEIVELEQKVSRLVTASNEQCKKIEMNINKTQDEIHLDIMEWMETNNMKIIGYAETQSTHMNVAQKDIRNTKRKIGELESMNASIQKMLRMNDLAEISIKGSIPKRLNVTTAIYEDKIYQLSPFWCSIISSNSLTGRKCVSLYSIDKKRAIHVYYTDEKYFYFFNENEFKYDFRDDSITKVDGELHLEWKRIASEVVNIPVGSFFSKSKNGKSAVFYVREMMIIIRLNSGDVIVLDSNSENVYVNSRKLIMLK